MMTFFKSKWFPIRKILWAMFDPDETVNEEKTSINLSGRELAILLLHSLPEDERQRLLSVIASKNPDALPLLGVQRPANPALKDISSLSEEMTAEMLASVLRTESVEIRKKVLSVLPRPYAENVYKFLKEQQDCDVTSPEKTSISPTSGPHRTT